MDYILRRMLQEKAAQTGQRFSGLLPCCVTQSDGEICHLCVCCGSHSVCKGMNVANGADRSLIDPLASNTARHGQDRGPAPGRASQEEITHPLTSG